MTSSAEALATYRLAENNAQDGLAFCELYNSLYAKKVDLAYYNWQFFDTPFPSLLCLADVAHQPVGFYGVHLLKGNRADAQTGWILDIMIQRDYQDRGIFRALAEFAKTQMEPYQPKGVFVMANPDGASAHVYGLGWKQINVLHSFVAKIPNSNLGTQSILTFEQVSSHAESSRGWLITECINSNGLFAINRDAVYTGWRFGQNPRFRYTQFKALEGSRQFGHLVLKTFQDPKTGAIWGDIVDLGWVDAAPDLVSDMLRFALRSLCEQGASQALIWLQTNTILDQLGREIGFQQTDQERYFCGEVIDQQYESLLEPDSWFLTLSDSEVY
jgi:hypothetical protein